MTAFGSLDQIPPHRIWDGVVGRVVAGDRLTFVVVELEANAVVPEHAHENEQVGVLASGSMRFRIGDEERQLLPGGTWSIPAHAPHEVTAGPEGAVAIEVFAPGRADWDALDRIDPAPPAWPG